jgi:hypothetical protein
MSSTSKTQSGTKPPVQPAPPRHNTTASADPDLEPNPGDPGFPLIEPRVPEDYAEVLANIPMAPSERAAPRAGTAAPVARAKAGDEVPPGSEQSGENLCRTCGGSAAVAGRSCPDCNGTGTVNTLVGDA